MGKFLLNIGVITALLGSVGVIRATRRGPRDWRLALRWVGWACTLAIAVGTVLEDNRLTEIEE